MKENTESPVSPSESLVMVIDDEEMVLKVICLIIAKMGYRPVSFSRSTQALEFYKNHAGEIDLVLMDMVMPELSGKDLFFAMKEINPQIRAILLSGWINQEDNRNIHQWGLQDFLQKPIDKIILENSIKKALSF